MNDFFAGMTNFAVPAAVGQQSRERHELDCKMTIVVRSDKKSGITGGGTSAKFVSLAVIKAYEKAKEFDPVSLM